MQQYWHKYKMYTTYRAYTSKLEVYVPCTAYMWLHMYLHRWIHVLLTLSLIDMFHLVLAAMYVIGLKANRLISALLTPDS